MLIILKLGSIPNMRIIISIILFISQYLLLLNSQIFLELDVDNTLNVKWKNI